jgi:hypothetical protein
MTSRNAVCLAVCAVALSGFGSLANAHAQSAQAPFTIRRPPDGATVREKVRIEIPRASIRPGGFVAFYIDDKFQVALAPTEGGNQAKPFTYLWDTKASNTPDGEHTIRAVLFEPAGGAGDGISTDEKGSSSIHLTVANRIHNGPHSLLLRYKYHEGEDLVYRQDSKQLLAQSSLETGTTEDQEMSSVDSTHQIAVEDSSRDVALVRNKLTSLKVLESGQEYSLGGDQLSNSMYQELDPLGIVHYETGSNVGLAEFTARGLPVNSTLELPLLPTSRVSIGETWRTPNQRLDLPGLPPSMQPRVTLVNKLEDLEWESGYPTARIHQTFSGPIPLKVVPFGSMEITSPNVKFERDIFLAYKSGTLIRTARTLTITGRSATPVGTTLTGPMAGGMPGMMRGGMAGGYPGMMRGGMPGMPGMMPGAAGEMAGMVPGMPGGATGKGGYPGMMRGGMPGMPGAAGMMRGGMAGGYPGMMQGGAYGARGRMGGGAMPGMMRGGMPGMPGAYPGMMRGGMAGGYPNMNVTDPNNPEATDYPVTVKAITTTQLQSRTGGLR